MSQKKKFSLLKAGVILIGLSVILHVVHYLIFRDLHHVLLYFMGDLAFIPFEVFIVSLVIDRVIEGRERKHVLEKLNMLIGLFYSEIGNSLLMKFAHADVETCYTIKDEFKFDFGTTSKDFDRANQIIKEHVCKIDLGQMDLIQLKKELGDHKSLLVNLLSNPSLLENESFSNLLLAVFHLNEELAMRELFETPSDMSKADADHIKVDIERAYRSLSVEWVSYMRHLKVNYPFLYLTACEKNPFSKYEVKLPY